ncbi:AAA family ATPase [Methanobrevibacter oralis]|nr:ATP-binding protein [Methanobrevibacter oralis]
MELPQKIVDSSDEIKGFIIVIDEFQLLGTIKSPEAFFWLIRSYSQQQFNVSYIFTGSVSKTSEVTEMLNGQTGAFGGRMIQIDIEPFSREETKRYVDERSNNVKFSDKGFNQFYLCTKGIPIYINTLCSILPANSVCDENIILENIKLNIDHIALMWIYVWGRLNANEREIVILLNENNGANWTTLKNSLPYSTPTISKYLDSLSNKGIVDYDFNKKYVISDNMLKTWLSIKKEQNGRYPL